MHLELTLNTVSSHHPHQHHTSFICFNVQLGIVGFTILPVIGILSNLQKDGCKDPVWLIQAFVGGPQCKQGPRSGFFEIQIYHPLQESPLDSTASLPTLLLNIHMLFCCALAKKGCFNSHLSTDLCFLFSISSPCVFLLGYTEARFPTMNAGHSFLVPALIFMRISHRKFCSLDPRRSPSPALFMRHNSFYGIRSAFASSYTPWAADGKDT